MTDDTIPAAPSWYHNENLALFCYNSTHTEGEWDEAEPLLASKKSPAVFPPGYAGVAGYSAGLCRALLALQGFDPQNNFVSMLFLLAVFLIATVTDGYVYGIASSFLSVLLVNYVFTYPYFRSISPWRAIPSPSSPCWPCPSPPAALTSKAKRNAAARLEADREKTRGNLLRAVSHDLRTTADRHPGRLLRAAGA